MEQFLRIDRLIGQEKRESLGHKKVTIVGMGAVGGYALEALARSGVGHFQLIDFDHINPTNINRQLLALWSTIGTDKVDAAKERVQDINPNCRVDACKTFAHHDTLDELFEEKPDLIIDAIDALGPKVNLLAYAYEHKIPVISSMGAALRTDPFAIRKDDLMKTEACPLARQIRKRLRRRGVRKGITVIYSKEHVTYDYKNPEDEDQPDANEQIIDRGRPRRVLGSLPTVTGMFGLHIANAALEELLGTIKD